MNLLGPHIHKAGMGLDLLERGQFAAALAMDVDSAYVREVRQRSPGTTLVVRVYEDGAQFLEWSPQDWVNRLLARFPTDKPDHFVTINEPFGHDSSELFERFDIWESEVIRLLQAAGTDGLACNFGTGNFTAGPDRVKIPDAFPRICAVANVMGGHDYSWPDLWDGVYWYALRWTAWYDDILAATGKTMKFLIGECGLTQAIIWNRPDHGWRSGGPEGVTDASYLDSLRWYNNMLCQWEAEHPGMMLGACIFNFYDQFHWTFEHVDKPDIVNAIFAMDCPVIPEQPPEPPEPPEDDMIRVVDKEYNEQTEEWAKQKYGVAWRRAEVEPGQKVYRLVELWEKTGNHSLITQALNEDGQPMPDKAVTFYWPDAPAPPDPPTEVYPHDGYTRFTWGLTNANGEVGPGMGTGAYHGEGEGGPHAVWIHDPNIPSDICEKLGMLAGTFHDHLDQKFKLVTAGEEPEPPPVDGDLLEEVKEIRLLVAEIRNFLKEETPPEPEQEIFHAEYFDNMSLEGVPVLVRDEETIDHFWGEGSPGPPVPADYFSARWTGDFTFETGSDYHFHVIADDGFRLLIDGELKLEAWKQQSPTQYDCVVNLSVGKHEIKVEYFEQTGGATIRVWRD